MLRLQPLFGALILVMLVGCRQDPNGTDEPTDTDNMSKEESNAEWEELEEDGSDGSEGSEGGKDDDAGDTGKSDGDGDCGDDVEEGAACEGDWEETLCFDSSGTAWWCEDGAWTSKK